MDKGRYYFSGELEVIGTTTVVGKTYLKVRSNEDEEWLFLPELWLDAELVMPEPGDGSVVLDAGGDAWQRYGNTWSMAGANSSGNLYEIPWAQLEEEWGPLRVIHEPED